MGKIFILSLLILFKITGIYATSIKASTFGWNSTDATTAFRNAISASYDTIIVDLQTGDWIVKPNSFSNLSNKTIIFEPGVVLLAKPGAFPGTSDGLFALHQCNNIKIVGDGATFKMQKAEYNTGEWRHTLSMSGCSNIEVYGLKLNDSGGDGVYITGACSYIFLKNLWCDNNRRQGISVISAQHLRVENCWFTNTNGTAPSAGVDLEPNGAADILVDIVFDKCRFTGNVGGGIEVSIPQLDSTSLPVSCTFSNCYVNSPNDNAGIIFFFWKNASNPCSGTINFENCMTDITGNSGGNSVEIQKPASGFRANFNNCVFKDAENPIRYDDIKGFPGIPYGGTAFTNCLIFYNSTNPFIYTQIYNTTSEAGIANVQFNNLKVINPNNVTYKVITPSSDCVFDWRRLEP